MSRKKRVLRVGCISLLLLVFVGYFAFSTFFFPPFEGKFKADVAALIPRNVDVYLARADLKAAFDEFPTFAVQEKLAKNPAVNTFLESSHWQELDSKNKITKSLDDIKKQLDQLPMGLNVFDIAAGDEVALAANFVGEGLDGTDWAIYARATRYGKLAVSALKHPKLLRLDSQGLNVSQSGDVMTVSGGRIKKPIHVTRILDVIIAGTSLQLVEEARALEASGSQGSLFMAAPYSDSIASVDRDKNQRDIEVQFNVRELRDKWGMQEEWLDPESQRFMPAFFARLLPLAAVKRLLGIVDFEEGVSIDLSGEFSTELMTAPQERVYRAKGFDQAEVMDVAGFVPSDATVFGYLRAPMTTLFDMVLAALEPAAVENLTDAARAMNYSTLSELVVDLDNSLHDRVAVVARPNDWGYEGDMTKDPDTGEMVYTGPPNDGKKVFAWAIIAWMKDPTKITEIREKVAQAGPRVGIQGRDAGQAYFSKTISGGIRVREFWSPLVPGTGHIAVLLYGENLIISNRYAMIDELVKNRVAIGPNVPLLKNDVRFQYLLQDSVPTANLLAWVNPGTGTSLLKEQASEGARGKIANTIDFATKRREVESEVLRNVFSGKTRAKLTADEATRLDDIVDQKLILFREEVVEQNLPKELASVDRMVTYLQAITAGLTMINLSPKVFNLSVRVDTPYEPTPK